MQLSIIIPAYNVEKYIDECLIALIPQLTPECELIIVDDCSTDTTKLRALTCKDKWKSANVRVYQNVVNSGVSASRNMGLHTATGKYIAFVDGDDVVTPDYVSSILMAVKSNKDHYRLSWITLNKPIIIYKADKLPDWNCSVWSRIFKKELIVSDFLVGCNFGEDGRFLNENITPTMSCGYILNTIYKYRNGREGSLTNTFFEGKT